MIPPLTNRTRFAVQLSPTQFSPTQFGLQSQSHPLSPVSLSVGNYHAFTDPNCRSNKRIVHRHTSLPWRNTDPRDWRTDFRPTHSLSYRSRYPSRISWSTYCVGFLSPWTDWAITVECRSDGWTVSYCSHGTYCPATLLSSSRLPHPIRTLNHTQLFRPFLITLWFIPVSPQKKPRIGPRTGNSPRKNPSRTLVREIW